MFISTSRIRRIRLSTLSLLLVVSIGIWLGFGLNAAAKEKVTLHVQWTDFTEATKKLAVDKLIPDFEKENPDIDLEISFIGWGQCYQKLFTAYAAGVLPDVFCNGGEDLGMFVTKGLSLPLDKFVAGWDEKDDFYEGLWDTGAMYKGQVYRIPTQNHIMGTLYRKDFFESVGLDPNSPPETWEALRNAAVKLTERDEQGEIKRMGFAYYNAGYSWQFMLQLMWGNNATITNKDMTKATGYLNSPEFVEALQFYSDLVNRYKVMPREMSIEPPAIAVGAGITAMMWTGAVSGLQRVEKYFPEVYKNMGVTSILGNRVPATYGAVSGWSISTQSKYPEEAWTFIKFMVRPDNLWLWNESYRLMPCQKSVGDRFERKYPMMKKLIEGLEKYGHNPPVIPVWGQMYEGFHNAIQEAIYERKTAKQALDDYAKILDQQLRE